MSKSQLVQLKDIGMLLLESAGDGEVVVHSFGPEYTQPPTCREAADAMLAWVAAVDREKTAIGTSLSSTEFAQAGAHLRAFVDEIGSSYFRHGQIPQVVVVPGLGRWTFVSALTAE